MTKVCPKVIPKLLTCDQHEKCQEICADILKQMEKNPKFLDNMITCYEMWIFQSGKLNELMHELENCKLTKNEESMTKQVKIQ